MSPSNAEHTSSDKLLEVEVPVVSNAVCQTAMNANVSFDFSYNLASSSQHKFQITDAMLCAGGEVGKDSCQVEQTL